MTLQVSTGTKTALLMAFPAIFNGGVIHVYAGTQPASADHAATGTFLGAVTLNGLPEGTGIPAKLNFEQSGPYIIKPYTDRWVLAIAYSGIPTWFRLFGPGTDDDNDSYARARIDGRVTLPADGGELQLPSLVLTAGDVVAPLSFFYTILPIVGA